MDKSGIKVASDTNESAVKNRLRRKLRLYWIWLSSKLMTRPVIRITLRVNTRLAPLIQELC